MNILIGELALAAGMIMHSNAAVDPAELICLSRNIYYEARGEDKKGQLAVAFLTLNRVKDKKYPNTICGVVTEDRGPGKHDCQFSWYCDGKSDTPKDSQAYQKAMMIALETITGRAKNPVPGATHYYAPKIASPFWAASLTEVAVIGNHRFMAGY